MKPHDLLLPVITFATVIGAATAQRPIMTLLGSQPGAAYGRTIAAAGDVDGPPALLGSGERPAKPGNPLPPPCLVCMFGRARPMTIGQKSG